MPEQLDPTPVIPAGASDELKQYLQRLDPIVWVVLNKVRKGMESKNGGDDQTLKAQVV